MMREEQTAGLPALLLKVAFQLSPLGNGPRARIRRMDPDVGCSDLYRILAIVGIEGPTESWVRFAKIVAILTPNKETPEERAIHNGAARLGDIFFESGISELQLNRFCSAPLPQRRDMLERMARGLKTRSGADLVAIGLLIFSETPDTVRRVARDYFAAEAKSNLKEISE